MVAGLMFYPPSFILCMLNFWPPGLQTCYLGISHWTLLPVFMAEAIIVLVPKPGKDPHECASYRAISLLNVDAKIRAKILATQFSTVLDDLIQLDQSSFMPMMGNNIINIRCLFLNLSVPNDNMGTKVIALLDAEKAFDSVECTYLRFGLGLSFCSGFSFL